MDYRQNMHACFDIETLEQKHERDNDTISSKTVEEAILRPVSIGCSNNINHQDKFFLRQSSHPDDAYELVNGFMDHLFELVDALLEAIPNEINTAIQVLQEEIENSKMSSQKCEKQLMLKTLKAYRVLCVYGYNSCKFKPIDSSTLIYSLSQI